MFELFTVASQIVRQEQVCDRCLGRCYARLGSGLTNEERGHALRVVLAMEDSRQVGESPPCVICQGVFTAVEHWATQAVERIDGYEFNTYLMGTRVPTPIEEAERTLWEKHQIDPGQAEPIKQEFNRETGKRFGQIMASKGKPILVDFCEPEIVFLIDLDRGVLSVRVHSLFIYGRYCKLVRGIPQTKWPCRSCKGRGCRECKFTGKTYAESVEELMAAPVVEASQGREHALHGAGREDVDARMLGSGRPFVLEIISPRHRTLDLGTLQQQINQRASGKVEVSELCFVKSRVVEQVKEMEAQKSYRARVVFERTVSEEELQQALQQLVGKIEQRTPHRVSHRRADLVRTRRVFAIQGELMGQSEALIEISCDGGLYVKELVSGDEGRTHPSLSELLLTRAQVSELDVMEVRGDFPC